jgi:hypothetical protein
MTKRVALKVAPFLIPAWVMLIVGSASVCAADPRDAESPPTLQVSNEAGKLFSLTANDWKTLPRRQVEVKENDGSMSRYDGVSLVDVLRFARVPFDNHLRGPRVASYILIEAADAYRAVFALADIDPSMTDRIVLVADRRDGKPLSESAGPYRLVVPGDKLHSRWVRQVVKISIQIPQAASAVPRR